MDEGLEAYEEEALEEADTADEDQDGYEESEDEDFEFDDSESADQDNDESEDELYSEFAVDENGDVQNYKVYGLDAIIVWATLALNIARERFEIFSDQYGCDIDDIVGKISDREYAESLMQIMIRECLTQNKHIQGIENFSIEHEGSTAYCSFTVLSDYGESDMDVTL